MSKQEYGNRTLLWAVLFGVFASVFMNYGVVSAITTPLNYLRINTFYVAYFVRLFIVVALALCIRMKRTGSVIFSSALAGITVCSIVISALLFGARAFRNSAFTNLLCVLALAALFLLASITGKRKVFAIISLAFSGVVVIAGIALSMFDYRGGFIGLSAWAETFKRGSSGVFGTLNALQYTGQTMLMRYFSINNFVGFLMLGAALMAAGDLGKRSTEPASAVETAVPCSVEPAVQPVSGEYRVVKSKVAAALFAGLLGGTGTHRYYLGYKGQGAVQTCGCAAMILGYIIYIPAIVNENIGLMLLACVLLLAGCGTGIWSFVDFIRILTGNLKPLGGVYESDVRPAPAQPAYAPQTAYAQPAYAPQTAPAQPVYAPQTAPAPQAAPAQPAYAPQPAPVQTAPVQTAQETVSRSEQDAALDTIKRLSQLRDSGILSDEEYLAKKNELLSKL